MTTELATVAHAPPAPAGTAADLVAAFLDGRSPRTLRAYAADLAHFARWSGSPTASAAVDALLALGAGPANGTALAYRNAMKADGLAPATVARRLAALRSVVKMGRTLGRVSWTLEIASPKREPRRDVRGPDQAERKKLWKALDAAGDGPKARRDRALVALLFDLGLRRAEALGLDLADVDLKSGSVAIVGKGKTERERFTLPAATRKALAAWVESRGDEPGPLFYRCDRGASAGRLTGDGLARTLAAVGRRAGLPRPLRPHGLRHAAITAALDSGADVREVRRFSRHAKIETVIRYDDDRSDVAGRIAGKISRERR